MMMMCSVKKIGPKKSTFMEYELKNVRKCIENYLYIFFAFFAVRINNNNKHTNYG